MIKLLGDKVVQCETKLDAMHKNTDMEKIRQEIIAKQKRCRLRKNYKKVEKRDKVP